MEERLGFITFNGILFVKTMRVCDGEIINEAKGYCIKIRIINHFRKMCACSN